MAPMKRGADVAIAAPKNPENSADTRARKRQRKDEKTKGSMSNATDDPQQSSKTSERAAAPSLLKQDERAFPRGGAGVLTPFEHKQIQAEAARDVLFEQAGKRGQSEDAASEKGDVAKDKPSKTASKKRKKAKSQKGVGAEENDGPHVKVEGLSYRVREELCC